MNMIRKWSWKECQTVVQRRHHLLGLGLVSALYILTLLALSSIPKETLEAFQQFHRFSTDILLPNSTWRQPIIGPMRIEHTNRQNITRIMRQTMKFAQDHSLMDAGEPWVKAVATLALRQIRNPNLRTSIYSHNCNWAAQGTADRNFTVSIVPPAWKYSASTGLPPMQGSWCTVPDGGYYLGLRLGDMADHELCRSRPIGEASKCVKELLDLIMFEFEGSDWIDDLTSTVTVSLTVFDFRHGLAFIMMVVGEKPTPTSWIATLRVSLVYPQECSLKIWTLVTLLLITVFDIFFSPCIRLKKRALLVALDVVMLLTVLVRLVTHFTEVSLLRAATTKFLEEIRGQPRRSNRDPYGTYEGIEALAAVEKRITTLETVWMLTVLLKILSLEWYGTRGSTFFILIFRRALRKSYSLLFAITTLVVVHALAFYRFLGSYIITFEFFDSTFSTMVGYTVGIFKHEVFFLKSLAWKVIFLLSALTLFLLGSQYVLTLFLSTVEAVNETYESLRTEEEESEVSPDKEDLDDEVFLRIVKEELERALTSSVRRPTSTISYLYG